MIPERSFLVLSSFAAKGTQVDGHKFIGMALEKGAIAIVCEDLHRMYEKILLISA